MKLWVINRNMLNYSNYHRPISIYTLCVSHRTSLLVSSPYFSRCKLRMNHSLYSCQRRLHIFPIPVHPYGARNLLWVLQTNRNMKYRSYSIYSNYSNSLYRICSTLRSNKILRCHSNYKPLLRHSLHRQNTSRVNVRGLCCR